MLDDLFGQIHADHMLLILAELGLASQNEVDLTADHPVEGRVRVLGLEDLLAFTGGFLICLLLLFLDATGEVVGLGDSGQFILL